MKKIRWIGPGIFLNIDGVAFPGDVVSVSDARASFLIGRGRAISNLLQRVQLFDADHPPLTKKERREAEERARLFQEAHKNTWLHQRLHPHHERGVNLEPLPLAEEEA